MKKIFITALVICISGITTWGQSENPATTAVTDSIEENIKINELPEIVVKTDNLIRKADGALEIYPSKKDKSMANGGIDVLRNMGITELNINPISDQVSTLSDQDVALFINEMPASYDEVKSIRTQDIKKIELLYYPTKPCFRGAQVVLNYVTQKYLIGGYTKLNANVPYRPTSGSFNIYSKAAYKSMTFDARVGTGYGRTRHNGTSSFSEYFFPTEEITKESRVTSFFAKGYYPRSSFRAIYKGANCLISNSVGYNGEYSPCNNQNGKVVFSSPNFLSGTYSQNSTSHRNAVKWDGDYTFYLKNQYTLQLIPSLSYSKADNTNSYETNETSIANDITERVTDSALHIGLNKNFPGKSRVGIIVSETYTHNDIVYAGSTNSTLKHEDNMVGVNLNGSLKLNKFNLYLNAYLLYEHIEMNNNKSDLLFQNILASFNYSSQPYHYVNFEAQYVGSNPGASYKSPLMILENELDAVKGNPDLKRSNLFIANAYYSYKPISNLSISTYANFVSEQSPIVSTWNPIEIDNKPYMARTYINDGTFTTLSAGVSTSLSLFQGRLMLQFKPEYNLFNRTGIYQRTLNDFKFNTMAYWRIGNVQLSAYYQSKSIALSSSAKAKAPAYYQLSAGWAHKDLYVQVALQNLFNKGYGSGVTEFESPYYYNLQKNYSYTYHRTILVTLSYSFNYGKKIEHGNEIDSNIDSKSAILK